MNKEQRKPITTSALTRNMELTVLALLVLSVLVGATAYEGDCRTDYLSQIMNASKLRQRVNGELNFSPNEGEFSNAVRSIAGKRGWWCLTQILLYNFPTCE